MPKNPSQTQHISNLITYVQIFNSREAFLIYNRMNLLCLLMRPLSLKWLFRWHRPHMATLSLKTMYRVTSSWLRWPNWMNCNSNCFTIPHIHQIWHPATITYSQTSKGCFRKETSLQWRSHRRHLREGLKMNCSLETICRIWWRFVLSNITESPAQFLKNLWFLASYYNSI